MAGIIVVAGERMSDIAVHRSDRRRLMACLLVALGVRLFVLVWQSPELTRDRDAYLGIARGIPAGRGLCSPDSIHATAFRPPLYPILLGGLMTALPEAATVAGINLVFGLVAVWTTSRIGRALGLRSLADGAALLVAIDPLLLQYTVQPMTEVVCAGIVGLLLMSLLSLQVHRSRDMEPSQAFLGSGPSSDSVQTQVGSSEQGTATTDSARGDQWFAGLVAGALFGLLVLCRPTFWPFAGLMVAGAAASVLSWFASKAGSDRERGPTETRTTTKLWFGAIMGTALVVGPWVLRNGIVFGTPVLTTTHGGYTLLLANNEVFYREVVEQPWGRVWEEPSLSQWVSAIDHQLDEELGRGASEVERDVRLNRQAREFIRRNPDRFAKAAWHRVRSLWSPVPLGESVAGRRLWLVRAVGTFYVCELIAFLAGTVIVLRRRDQRRAWWPLFALVLTVQAVHLAYWTNARMRGPLTPVIALLAVVPFSGRKGDSSITTVR